MALNVTTCPTQFYVIFIYQAAFTTADEDVITKTSSQEF